jgi:hypothetical protein
LERASAAVHDAGEGLRPHAVLVDYPFENVDEAAEFLDNAPISESDRAKLAHKNACKLFRLPTVPRVRRKRSAALSF